MRIVKHKLDYKTPWMLPDIYIFTANNTLKKNGALVMGAGAAKDCRDAYDGIDLKIGSKIKENVDYFLKLIDISSEQKIGVFQVKRHYSNNADINLIKKGAEILKELAEASPNNIFHMNFPGIGFGNLEYNDVLKVLKILPDNVLIYEGEKI